MDEVEPHMAAHMDFVREQFDKGRFLFSGKKVPRTGGIIVSSADDRQQLDEIIKQDPFCEHNLVDVDVLEFSVSTTCSELDFLKNM